MEGGQTKHFLTGGMTGRRPATLEGGQRLWKAAVNRGLSGPALTVTKGRRSMQEGRMQAMRDLLQVRIR